MRAVGCNTRGMPRPGGIGGQAPQPPRVPPPAPVAQGRIAEADDGLGIVPVMNVSDITRQLGYIVHRPYALTHKFFVLKGEGNFQNNLY